MLGGEMILTQIKAYGWMALSIFFGTLLASQTVRLHFSQLAEAKAVLTLAQAQNAATEARNTLNTEAREKEKDLNTSAADTRKDTNDSVRKLTTQRDDLVKRLRYAEANAATANLISKTTRVTCDGEATSRDSGTQLPNTLGAEDVDEALRADTIREHLKACYTQYDKARQTLSQ